MGRKERARHDYRSQVMSLVNSEKPLTEAEIKFIKEKYSGIGGLQPNQWSFGQFFSPPNVVEFVHRLIGINENTERIFDASCGAGAFFEGIDETRCTGMEISCDPFQVARVCYPGAELYRINTEECFPRDATSQFDNQFGFCIGNPPFGVQIPWSGALAKGKGRRTPSEVVFIEISYRACRPGGKIALILPEGILNSNVAKYVREWLMQKCILKAVVSLPIETFYHAGTACKTSIVYLEKLPEGVTIESLGNYNIFMALAENIGWNSRGQVTGKDDLGEILIAWQKTQHGIEIGDNPAITCTGTPISDNQPAKPITDDVPPKRRQVQVLSENCQLALF